MSSYRPAGPSYLTGLGVFVVGGLCGAAWWFVQYCVLPFFGVKGL